LSFHPQPPESGLLESGVGNLDLEDRKFQTDLLSVPFGEWLKLRGLRLEFLRSFLCFLSVELTLINKYGGKKIYLRESFVAKFFKNSSLNFRCEKV
jgi:hypothetical protein